MKIKHYFNANQQIQNNVQGQPGFLLTNQLGGYLWLDDEPQSRYQGWFFAPPDLAGRKIFKVIENIRLSSPNKITELRNNFWNAERVREHLRESFFLPCFFNALVYNVSQPQNIEIILDIKESYNNREDGRHYEIAREGDFIIVKYWETDGEFPPVFLAIKADCVKIRQLKQWLCRQYSLDQERNSPPFERYIFKALRLFGSQKIIFAADQNKNKACKTAEYVFKNHAELKESKRNEIKKLISKTSISNKQINIAYLCAKNALRSLTVSSSSKFDAAKGLYAGLPWFFQFWRRDEAICLKALAKLMPAAAKDIFWREWKESKSQNKFTDSFGWIIKRADEFWQRKILTRCEFKKIKTDLQAIADQMGTDFCLSGQKQTWMDSLDRSGAPLEMQALKLQMYRLLARSNVFWRSQQYADIERILRNKVRKHFWNDRILADRIKLDQKTVDFTVRPNIFLAAYIYPDLLTKKEWILCFKNILPKLWLNWGGLATIDKTNQLFKSEHTGEPALSYHQGDSWFYLNNLAALVLHHLDAQKFKKYINKILQASTQEILWHGIIGHHAELSSANAFTSQGCLAQSWSSAMYVEMVDALSFLPRNKHGVNSSRDLYKLNAWIPAFAGMTYKMPESR